MSVFKRLSRHPGVRRAAARLISAYIRFVHATTRWRIEGAEHRDAMLVEGKPVLGAFWHNRLALMPFIWPPTKPFAMLVSEHRDGQFIGDVVEPLGIARVSGSTSKGGARAFRALVQTLKSGVSVGITPDGPRGPRQRVQGGTIALARLAGVAIAPVALAVRPRLVLETWDGFNLPLPFGRGVFIWGPPFRVARDADEESVAALRNQLEVVLNDLAARADISVGLPAQRPEPEQVVR